MQNQKNWKKINCKRLTDEEVEEEIIQKKTIYRNKKVSHMRLGKEKNIRRTGISR